MNSEHLQVSHITLFRKGSLSREALRQASRHLLTCRDCRDLLPKPSLKEFLNSVFVELDDSVFTDEADENLGKKFFTFLSSFRPMLRPVFAALLFIAITGGLSLWFLSNPNNSTSANLVASIDSSELNGRDSIPGLPPLDSDQPTHARPPNRPNRSSVSTTQKLESKRSIPKSGRSQKSKLNTPVESETRNLDNPCGSVESRGLDTVGFDEGVKLIWSNVPKAARYAIYISDLNEKLVDHFETETETSYVSKVRFEQDVVYKWRLVVTLQSGETISSGSQHFSLNDSGEINSDKRNLRLQKRSSPNLRCTEKN